MRLLGYYEGYLGFLSHMPREDMARARVIDVGCGTGAMGEAFAAIHGPPAEMTLLDPSAQMLSAASSALAHRGIAPECRVAGLDAATRGSYDHVLAAHVIEHFSDQGTALADLRRITAPGGRLWLVASKPHWCNAIIWLQWRHRTFRKDALQVMLRDAGFLPEAVYDFPSGPPSRTSFGIVARAV
ncbi:ubiquinone/menaquinone biosynthesis C-methylase UbiE [Litoreibacter ponti]|uniref:Ubiquinone/menaquinone biosynthesis C-methylase UbiE n=1 Tax=Litoreibacter ponti TaxID=1510457 RepID=A0A2T6BLK6_9RHOB|nr:class I SAM-dependent methyltransferase [Litoreibacter ponti]PTX56935.1 ubiquinone/menaquinone biosynthesis C-methylase UbiE [Litoreibacter ponti]